MRILPVIVSSLSAFLLIPTNAVPVRTKENNPLFLTSYKNHHVLAEKSSHFSNNDENNKILLQQTEADDIMKLNDFYTDTMSTLQALKANEQTRLENTRTQLSATIQGAAVTASHELGVLAQEMMDKAHEEEETNKQLLNVANQMITKQILKIKSLQQDISNDIKDSTILTLENQLEKLKGKFDQVNARLQSFSQLLVTARSDCNDYTDCGSCTADAACGWCVSDQRCIEGDKIRPTSETCSFYSYTICSGSGCSGYKDCKSCLADSSCGWCGQTSDDTNSARCLKEVANYTGCPAKQWFHSEGAKNICDPEIKERYDLDAAETLEMLGYHPKEDEDVSLQNMKNKLEELQAESEALRERLKDVSEELKIVALERFPEA